MTKAPRALLALLFLVQLGLGVAPLVAGRATDFTAYRNASRALWEGRDPYLEAEPRYLYPPLLALALVPDLVLPERAAAFLWVATSAALIVFCVARLAFSARLVLLAIAFAPFAATQWNGQANALVLAALVLAREALDRGDEAWGGAAVGLAIALKPFALFAAVGLLLIGRWRAFAACAATLVGSFLLVLPFLGWEGVVSSAGHVAGILGASWPEPYAGNISLNGSLDRLVPDGAGALRHRAVAAAVVGGTLLLAAWVALRQSRERVPSSRVFDVLLVATLLAADSSWLHHSAVLFPLVSVASPLVAGAAVFLYAVAGGWHMLRDAAGAPAAAASLAGTLALVLLWLSSVRRLVRDDAGTIPPWPSTPNS